ncbi:hypothetical protein L3X38_022607 [Prunus dulcis]|uniref:Uncharacterized protein n=1 Tax=Prunus dulcis TaxID=3755 RepID=A0AAD4VWE9_PRUDU|nr:hypothetical protein L3X38_022607 [Prunus dulcis]
MRYEAAKRILRCLQRTIDYGIWYKPTTGPRIFGYTYNDWAGSVDDMKNTSGYAFTIGSVIFMVIKKTRYRDSIISRSRVRSSNKVNMPSYLA